MKWRKLLCMSIGALLAFNLIGLAGCSSGAASTASSSVPATVAPPSVSTEDLTAQTAEMTGAEAQAFYNGLSTFVWGYPLVFTEKLQHDRVLAEAPGVPQAALNQFGLVRDIRGPEYKTIAAPNNDTLYAHAFLDLREEPVILTVPKMENTRYYSFQLWDPYQVTLHYIGTRTTGNNGGSYAIVGPDWEGTLPEGVERVDVLDNLTVIWGRIGVEGPEDLENARAIQDALSLIPLSQFGEINTSPEPDWETSNQRVALELPADLPEDLVFYYKLANALRFTKPRPDDNVVFENLYRVGINENFEFDYKALSEDEMRGLAKAVELGNIIIDHEASTAGSQINGWNFSDKAGVFGTNYILRAATAKWYTGANAPEEAIYMACRKDENGDKLTGTNAYTIHFASNMLPRCESFWSLTMYDSTDGSLVENPISRYSIGDRTEGILYNPDGSLTIHIQSSDPGEGKNWLPSPAGEFYLMLRLYIPDDSLQTGKWAPPMVEIAK